jgi:hypothetical protein
LEFIVAQQKKCGNTIVTLFAIVFENIHFRYTLDYQGFPGFLLVFFLFVGFFDGFDKISVEFCIVDLGAATFAVEFDFGFIFVFGFAFAFDFEASSVLEAVFFTLVALTPMPSARRSSSADSGSLPTRELQALLLHSTTAG